MTVWFTEARYVECTEAAIEVLTMNINTAVFNKYGNIYKT